jgi:hypothetical protein
MELVNYSLLIVGTHGYTTMGTEAINCKAPRYVIFSILLLLQFLWSSFIPTALCSPTPSVPDACPCPRP